jgi:hypothetical protein
LIIGKLDAGIVLKLHGPRPRLDARKPAAKIGTGLEQSAKGGRQAFNAL